LDFFLTHNPLALIVFGEVSCSTLIPGEDTDAHHAWNRVNGAPVPFSVFSLDDESNGVP
jgi:hypothetical protein